MLRAEEHICSVSHMLTAVKHAEWGLDRYTTPTHPPACPSLNLHASLSQSPSIDPPRMCFPKSISSETLKTQKDNPV